MFFPYLGPVLIGEPLVVKRNVDSRNESVIEGPDTVGGEKKDAAEVLKGPKKYFGF